MEDYTQEITREDLRRKLRTWFDGKIVRKDLTKKIKEGANVPVYVLEFLLGQYCSSDDPEIIEQGVENVKRILAENYVRPDEAPKILSMLRQRGSYTVIDCIERIYNKIDNPNLQFVTQQMFRRSNNRIALADLYFPQLKLSVEIDEEYHKGNEDSDQERTEEILSRMNRLETIVPFEPDELRINAGTEITLEAINTQIDDTVRVIMQRIALLPELKWDSVFKTPEEYIRDGYVSADDDACFGTLWDVSKLFSKAYKKGCQCCWFDAIQGCCSEKVWCPKVSVNVEGYTVNVPYDNEISLDADVIYESAKVNNETFVREYLSEPKSKEIRYVFPYFRTAAGILAYVFKGVYALDKEDSRRMNKRVWKRISRRLDISKYHINPIR